MTLIHIKHPNLQQDTVLVRLCAKVIALAAELRRRREIYKSLGKLSPQELRDVGLILNDVETACSNPLSQEATTELLRTARNRGSNW